LPYGVLPPATYHPPPATRLSRYPAVDIALKGEMTAVEVDGSAHFSMNEPYVPLGRTIWRWRLLASRGWRVSRPGWAAGRGVVLPIGRAAARHVVSVVSASTTVTVHASNVVKTCACTPACSVPTVLKLPYSCGAAGGDSPLLPVGLTPDPGPEKAVPVHTAAGTGVLCMLCSAVLCCDVPCHAILCRIRSPLLASGPAPGSGHPHPSQLTLRAYPTPLPSAVLECVGLLLPRS